MRNLKTHSMFALLALFILSACGQGARQQTQSFKGEFVYYADAALFVECETGNKYMVAGDAYLELERQYTALQRAPRKVYVELEGALGKVPAMEGDGEVDGLLVSNVVTIDPNQHCLSGSNAAASGVYRTNLPAASSPGRTITLELSESGQAFMLTDFQNMEPIIIERGTWERVGTDKVRMNLNSPRQIEGEPHESTFRIDPDGYLVYQGDEYGSMGLFLAKMPEGDPSGVGRVLLDKISEITGQGENFMNPGQISRDKPLAELFEKEDQLASLHGFLTTRFGFTKEEIDKAMKDFKTVQDVFDYIVQSKLT
jgi:uncharacterized lipoprotein NlpE involved in copper resistance